MESATEIGKQLGVQFKDALSRLSLEAPEASGINISVDDNLGVYSIRGYKVVFSVGASIKTSRPVEVSFKIFGGVGLAEDLSSRFIYRLVARDSDFSTAALEEVPDLNLRFEEAYPSLSSAGHTRIEIFAETMLGWLVDRAQSELHKILRQAGYDSFTQVISATTARPSTERTPEASV
jgi:hypothetical protein